MLIFSLSVLQSVVKAFCNNLIGSFQEEEKVSTIKRNGNLGQSFEQVLLLCKSSFMLKRWELLLEFVVSGDEGEADAGRRAEEEGG